MSWLGKKARQKSRRTTDEPLFEWKVSGASLGSVAVIGSIGAIAYGVWSYAMNPKTLPLQQVQLEAPFKRVTAEELHSVIRKKAQGGFFNVDVGGITDALTEIAWVDAVTVRRIWPDTLHVFVVEQVPLARWAAGGVINHRGELFYPQTTDDLDQLVTLAGPDSSIPMMANRYREVSEQLHLAEIALKGITLTARRAWEMKLDNGVEVMLGRDETQNRLQRFVRFYPGLAPQAPNVERVDMRYPNGFTVKWRQPSEVWG